MASQFKTFVAGDVLTAAEVNGYLMKQAVIVCDSSSDYPGSPVEGMTVYDKALDSTLTYNGSSWVLTSVINSSGGLIAWTPTLTQSGSVSHTLNKGRYVQQGAVIHCWCDLSITGSGTAANAITVTAPVTANTSGIVVGAAQVYDSSATSRYVCTTFAQSTTTFTFRSDGGDGALGFNPSFGLASGDTIQLQATYLA